MLERILNAALAGEMDAHLSLDERSKGNRRNGKMPKQVQTRYGGVTIETPRDRDGSFDPQTDRKRKTTPAEGMTALRDKGVRDTLICCVLPLPFAHCKTVQCNSVPFLCTASSLRFPILEMSHHPLSYERHCFTILYILFDIPNITYLASHPF